MKYRGYEIGAVRQKQNKRYHAFADNGEVYMFDSFGEISKSKALKYAKKWVDKRIDNE